MRFEVEFDREEDGRWIAEIPSLPGVLAYGATRESALAAVETIACECWPTGGRINTNR